MTRDWNRFEDLKPLELSLSTYLPSKAFVKIDSEVKNDSIGFKIYENYLQQFEERDENFFEVIQGDIEEIFLHKSKSYQDLNLVNLFGISIYEENVTVWFNDQPWHALPISLNLLHNAIAKIQNLSINVANKPLPFRAESKVG